MKITAPNISKAGWEIVQLPADHPQIANGFDYLLEDLESTFAMIRTGEVFMPESLPAAA